MWGGDKDGSFTPGFCAGEITPQDKDNCNGTDDDCDGTVDDGKELQETDILFIVDWSGSMDTEISAVSQALGMFAANYADEEIILWGFIKGPVLNIAIEKLLLITDFVAFPGFAQEISVPISGPIGTKEMLADALYLVLHDVSTSPTYPSKSDLAWKGNVSSSPNIEDFSVSWRKDANKVIIIFTDEITQTFMDPPASIQAVLDTAKGVDNLKIYVFTTDNYPAKTGWEKIATSTGGKWFLLTYELLPMYYSLIEILDENICE